MYTLSQAALLRGFARKRLKEQKGVYEPLMGDPETDPEEVEWSDEVIPTPVGKFYVCDLMAAFVCHIWA